MSVERFRFFLIERTPSRPVLLIVTGWLLAGLSLILGSVYPIDVNPAINVEATEWVVGIMLVLGSLAVLLSAGQWKNKSTSWRLELSGWPVLGAAWLLYTVLILVTNWTSLFPILLGLAYASACAQRYFEVQRQSSRTRRNLSAYEDQQREGEELDA